MRPHATNLLFAWFVLIVGFGALPASAGEPFAPETTPIVGIDAGWACDVSNDGRWVAGAESDGQETATYAAKLVDTHTGTVVSVHSDIWNTLLELSDDGQLMTFVAPGRDEDSPKAHIYQYDRLTATTAQVTSEASVIDRLRTSPDGGLVFWSDRSFQQAAGLGPLRMWIWQRSTGQRVEVTRTEPGANPRSPFSGQLRPWLAFNDSRTSLLVWQALTGSEQPITLPPGFVLTDILGPSLDGTRFAYSRYTGQGTEDQLVVATRSGSILYEATHHFGGDQLRRGYYFSDAGDRLFIQISPNVEDSGVPHKLMWDLSSNDLSVLDLPSVGGLERISVFRLGTCGASSDLRWLVSSTYDHETLERGTVLVDTWTMAPTPVDPSMLEGDQLGDQIQRLYQAYFLRSPDSSGLAYWRSQRVGGTALGAVSTEFSSSPEFQQQYGSLDNAAFVDLIYQNVLDRVPDAEGRAHWIGVLDGGRSRGEVMLGFSESTEFINTTSTSAPIFDARIAQIDRLYRAHFDRAGDAGGLTYWFQRLKTGSSIADVATAFSTSPEFLATYGELDDAAFIDLIYQNVLGRAPDAEGRAHWIGVLAGGASRGVVMTNFSDSAEYMLATNSLPPSG